jgi:hypothetical protein
MIMSRLGAGGLEEHEKSATEWRAPAKTSSRQFI